jgi:hypothetical protein
MGWIVPGSAWRSGSTDASSTPTTAGFEIDTPGRAEGDRIQRGIRCPRLAEVFIGVTAARVKTQFDNGEEYNGTDLAVSLNRVDTTYGLNFRHELTPLDHHVQRDPHRREFRTSRPIATPPRLRCR